MYKKSGMTIFRTVSFPIDHIQVKFVGGIIGKKIGCIIENSFGFFLNTKLDIHLGFFSATTSPITDDKNNILGTVSWLAGLITLGLLYKYSPR